ncbi:hypothetical protein B296_00044553 [Ensete ventricosum]|uniref:Uncharacterized protein n=1 Tax=Ensete ventricosum TaxID=4639 RepID=A0A426ZAK6_ENSVE|nr:hypothetical protein B296_00044553 [Ensete ventricosum]
MSVDRPESSTPARDLPPSLVLDSCFKMRAYQVKHPPSRLLHGRDGCQPANPSSSFLSHLASLGDRPCSLVRSLFGLPNRGGRRRFRGLSGAPTLRSEAGFGRSGAGERIRRGEGGSGAAMALSGMRGLSVFISDVRNCQNKEQERLRVDKELGNIRTRFKNEKVIPPPTSFYLIYSYLSFGLSPYEKKKYVWKMLYIYMLGYDVDFGHTEAVSLISAPKYPEKQVMYALHDCFSLILE